MAVAVVTAAGAGRRIGGDIPKIEMQVLGRPLIYYTLLPFRQSDEISGIVLTVPPEATTRWSTESLGSQGIDKVIHTLAGGETRQESVRLALAKVPPDTDLVMIHDGARPLVTLDLIRRLVHLPEGIDGVIAAIPVTDTIKQVKQRTVERTLDRKRLVAVQTPQTFRYPVLQRAHRRAAEDGYEGTDDASLVERIGGKIAVAEGSRENLKVTYPEDIERVEAILAERGFR